MPATGLNSEHASSQPSQLCKEGSISYREELRLRAAEEGAKAVLPGSLKAHNRSRTAWLPKTVQIHDTIQGGASNEMHLFLTALHNSKRKFPEEYIWSRSLLSNFPPEVRLYEYFYMYILA